MINNCPFCNKEYSYDVLFEGSKNKDKKINVECTSHNSADSNQMSADLCAIMSFLLSYPPLTEK